MNSFCVLVNSQDQFALALSQAVGAAGKKEDELVGSKLNKVHSTKIEQHSSFSDSNNPEDFLFGFLPKYVSCCLILHPKPLGVALNPPEVCV